MNLNLSHFSKMLDAVYGTALDDGRWTDLFGAMQKTVGLEHFALHGYDNNLKSNTIAMLPGFDPSFAATYEEYYWEKNPWLPGAARAPIGHAMATESYFSEEQLRNSEFYNDWIVGQDDIGTGGAIVLFRDENRFLALGGNYKFSHRENMHKNWLNLLDLLSPHLRNAFELRRQLAGSQLKDARYLTALDAIGNAAFLLNSKGQVTYSNPAAQRMVKTNKFIFLNAGGALRAHDGRAAQALSKLLYEIAKKTALLEPKQVVLQSRTGFENAFATLAPFTPDPSNIDPFSDFAVGDIPLAIMTVTDPEQRKKPPRELLARLFRLTPAETDLALALSLDQSLYDYADEKQLSRHTVRNQLKAIFQKTGTHRQAELMRLLGKYVS